MSLVALAAAMCGGLGGVPATAAGSRQLQPGPVKELARGKILVAGRELRDPNFAETVVLVLDHNVQGTLGLVLNRPSETPLTRLLELPAGGSVPLVYQGGPVEGSGVLALVKSDKALTDTKAVLDGVYEITAPAALNDLVKANAGPDRLRVYYGYSGWSADQLERETRSGAWHVFNGSAAVVFDADPITLWKRLIPHADERMALSTPAKGTSDSREY
jgi:putative transcriptional regulator